MNPLGTSASILPIVPAPDHRWWVWGSRQNENYPGKPKYSEITCPTPTLSTANPIWPDLGSKPGRRGGKPATNHLNMARPRNLNRSSLSMKKLQTFSLHLYTWSNSRTDNTRWFNQILTYSRSWALLERPRIVQPLKNFPAFYGIWRFNTVFTRAVHWSLSWAISIQSTPSHSISLQSILILSTHLHLSFWLSFTTVRG
jgi:hypothetical protein